MTQKSNKAVWSLLLCLLASEVFAQQSCDSAIPQFSKAIYEDHGDGTITEKHSKLTWMRCAVGQIWQNSVCKNEPHALTWTEAKRIAESINEGQVYFYNDWHMPSLKEIAMITDMQCKSPRINLIVFPGTPAASFWTSSTKLVEGPELKAFAMHFGDGGLVLASLENTHYVRFVRKAD